MPLDSLIYWKPFSSYRYICRLHLGLGAITFNESYYNLSTLYNQDDIFGRVTLFSKLVMKIVEILSIYVNRLQPDFRGRLVSMLSLRHIYATSITRNLRLLKVFDKLPNFDGGEPKQKCHNT